MWLELLHGLGGVVEEGETGALATTELGAETEDGNLVLVHLVKTGELLAKLILGDVWARWVEDITVGDAVRIPALMSGGGSWTHTTICLRPSRGLRMNLRVRRVTWDSDMVRVVDLSLGERMSGRRAREERFTKFVVEICLKFAHPIRVWIFGCFRALANLRFNPFTCLASLTTSCSLLCTS